MVYEFRKSPVIISQFNITQLSSFLREQERIKYLGMLEFQDDPKEKVWLTGRLRADHVSSVIVSFRLAQLKSVMCMLIDLDLLYYKYRQSARRGTFGVTRFTGHRPMKCTRHRQWS